MKRIALVLVALMLCSGAARAQAAEMPQGSGRPDIFVQLGHLGPITSVAFSPDGKQAVTGSEDKTIKIWDVSTGREIRTISGMKEKISSIAVSPSGNYVLSVEEMGMNGNLKLWDMSSGKKIRAFKGTTTSVFETVVAITPDGRYAISGADDKTVKLWDMATGNEVRSFKGSTAGVTSIAVTPDGKYLLAGSRDNSTTMVPDPNGSGDEIEKRAKRHASTIRMWEIDTGKQIMACGTDTGWVEALAVSPDGTFLISTDFDDRARMWALPSGRQIKTFATHGAASVAISPDGRQVLFGACMDLQLWDIASGKELTVFHEPSGWVKSVAISPDGKYALSSSDGNAAKLWDIAPEKKTPSRFQELRNWVSTELGHGQTVKKIGKPIRVFGGYARAVAAVSMNAAGTALLVGQQAGILNLWNVASGRQIKTIKHTLGVSSAVSSPDGTRVAAGGWDFPAHRSVVKLWDSQTGEEICTLKSKEREGMWCRVFAITPDNGTVLWSDGIDLVLSALPTGREIQRFKGNNNCGAIKNALLSRDAHEAVAVNARGDLDIWDIATGRLIKKFKSKLHAGYTYPLGGSADGKTALTVSIDYSKVRFDFRFWDFAKSKVTRTRSVIYPWASIPPGDRINFVNAVALSRDGRFALLGDFSTRSLHLWDIARGKEVRIFKGRTNNMSSMGISPDGKYVYAGMDGTARLWSLATGREIASFISFTNGQWLVVTPEGFFTASSPKAARYLNVRLGNRVYGIDQLYDQLYRPDLVEVALKGDPEGEVARAARRVDFSGILAAGAPPVVSFVSPAPGRSPQRDVTVVARLTGQEGGIGKVEWRLNGMTVGVTEPGRGITIKAMANGEAPGGGSVPAGGIELRRMLTLSPGENTIEVLAYSKAGIASNPACLKLDLKDAISQRPALYILAVGIDKYRDRSLWLTYAVPDARALTARLKGAAESIFTGVHVTGVYDQHATFAGIKAAFARVAKEAKSNDVFILYLAGHGITLDGRYHFLPADFRYYNEESVRTSSIDQDHLQRWLAAIPARKNLVLLDTCDSGSFVEAQMAGRGLTAKTAIDKLVRATGRAVISASTDSQVALEGYKGHGVFTYALLQALGQADSKDGNRDGVTSTGEIANFIQAYVPDMTYKRWGYEQVPQVNLHGQSFPVAVAH